MKIAFFEIHDWEKEYLQKKLKQKNILFFEDELTEKNIDLVKEFDIISTFIYSQVDGKIIKKLTRAKAIITRSTGFDHIDIRACKKKGIAVLNVPHYGENTVAEHTFALILALSRKIHKSYERTIRGNFNLEGLRGFDLKGKTLGIIGLGHIGTHVARIAKGFDMDVIVVDHHKKYNIKGTKKLQFVTLNQLLRNADIISLHCPYNKKTHHMLNKKNMKYIKKEAVIINTARGGLIDATALIESLSSGHLGGVALDVLEEESLIKEEIQLLSKNFPKQKLENLIENHILLTFDNVLITPHNAFNSREALIRILEVTIDNIYCLQKNKCKNKIT